ncbi:MAG TPA: flavin reductase family protein [Limnobacter sp.]|nr:flavin reductase family protein [Limnobacter sp.]
MYFNTSATAPRDNYQLLTGAVVPRPIAWVSTLSAQGIANLAPYSFFTVASCKPPVLCVVQVNPRDRAEKDTLSNLLATRECVVNVVSHVLVDAMNISCGDYPPEVDEFEKAGLRKSLSKAVAAPGVEEALVRFECTLREVKQIGEGTMGGTMMLLDVLGVEVSESALQDGKIARDLLDAVGKLGGDGYCTTRSHFDLKRPQL